MEVQIGKMGSYLCQNDEGGAGTAQMQTVAEDGEFCGWTVGGPYALGMPRSYGVASGKHIAAGYLAGKPFWGSGKPEAGEKRNLEGRLVKVQSISGIRHQHPVLLHM